MIGWILIGLLLVAAGLEWLTSPERDGRDALTNLYAYAGYLLVGAVWTPVLYQIYLAVHAYALFDLGPFWMDPGSGLFWLSWGALFLLEDLAYYSFHRSSHAFGLLWAAHVTHHSSSRFNLWVSLRQSWTPFVVFPYWLPLLLLGFDPVMVLTAQFCSLYYQAWLHTERAPRLGPLEWIFNTPTHHRVHHGANPQYLDKNFGGVLILWDRLFGTFAALQEPVRYGIDREVAPALVGVHGWLELLGRSPAAEEKRT